MPLEQTTDIIKHWAKIEGTERRRMEQKFNFAVIKTQADFPLCWFKRTLKEWKWKNAEFLWEKFSTKTIKIIALDCVMKCQFK